MQKKLKFSTLALSLVQSGTAIQRNKKTNRQLCVASGSHVNDSEMTSNRFSAAVADGNVEESRVHLLHIWVIMSNKDDKILIIDPSIAASVTEQGEGCFAAQLCHTVVERRCQGSL